MEYRNLGHSGLQLSVVGLGCTSFGMNSDGDTAEAIVNHALDLGITFFDTADVYGGNGTSEIMLGKALGSRRHDVVIGTKFGVRMGEGPMQGGASRRWIMSEVEASLRRLGTDYIDLYQIHLPDRATPLEETLRALDDLVRAGKVRYIGHSNFAGWQATAAHYVARAEHLVPFVSAQNNYSLLDRHIEEELVPVCRQYGIGILPYFPLASGLLTGRYRPGDQAREGTGLAARIRLGERMLSERNFELVEKLTAFAEAREHTLLQLAFGWLASQPQVASIIAGASHPDHVTQNVAACTWRLGPDELAEIDSLMSR